MNEAERNGSVVTGRTAHTAGIGLPSKINVVDDRRTGGQPLPCSDRAVR
jgi:hypothetical protein